MGRGGGRGRTTVACTVAAATTAAPPRAAHLSATPPAFPRARTRGAALPSPTSRPIRRQRPAARASCACCSGRLELPRPPHLYSTQPRRLLFAGPQTANNFLRLIESVHLIDAPHRTPHALAARTPPAGGCPHAVLAEGMRATWCCRRQLAAPGGSRRGGWDASARLRWPGGRVGHAPRGTAPFGVTCQKRVPEFWVKCAAQNIFACILARAIPRQVLRVRGPRLGCV